MPRLPIPGQDDGTWGALLNDFLLVEHNADGTLKSSGGLTSKVDKSTLTAKGDLYVASASATITREPVGADGTALIADASQSTGLRWAQQDPGLYPASGYGMVAITGDPLWVQHASFSSGALFIIRMWIPYGAPVRFAGVGIDTPPTGAPSNDNGVVIYSDDGQTQLGTILDPNFWNVAGAGWQWGTLSTPVAGGQFVRVAILINGWSGASLFYLNVDRGGSADKVINGGRDSAQRRAIFNNGVNTFPATFTPTSYGIANEYLPLIGLASV
ncbi:MAG TPA: hypothetical protein VF466_05385 [Candidatus Saccharimonadales bacterium]